jgi:hypothetical protein
MGIARLAAMILHMGNNWILGSGPWALGLGISVGGVGLSCGSLDFGKIVGLGKRLEVLPARSVLDQGGAER